MLLLVADKVLGACLYASALNASDGVCKKFTSEVGVGTEALPVTTSLRRLYAQMLSVGHVLKSNWPTHPSETTCNGSKLHSDAFVTALETHGFTALIG